MPNIRFEPVTLENLRDVTNLRVADHQEGFVADNARSIAWSRYLSNLIPSAIFSDDDLVGFVLYGEWEEEPGLWGIARFMIDEKHQGQGIGKAAMRELIRLIRERDPEAHAINLSYVPENDAARRLYASVGFVETGEMRGREVEARLDLLPLPKKRPAARPVQTYVFITTRHPSDVVRAVRQIPGVVRADALLGTPDAVALVEGRDIAEMDAVIDRIAEIPEVEATDSKVARWID
ncbi:MAG TPA: GNAT family N-acetyltransferase [Chloroflexia bacterium]|nr:GNAT family N-acetyltransferase [Chloroflexia bacterium]